MHQRASPLMPVAVQCPLFGPLSGLQSCDMKRLRKTCDAPPLAALFWEGQESRTPICARVYEEAVGAGTVFVLGETAWQEVCQFSRKLQKIVAAQLELGRGTHGLGVAVARNRVDQGEANPYACSLGVALIKVRKQVPMAAQARPPASISPPARAPPAGGDRAPFCARSIPRPSPLKLKPHFCPAMPTPWNPTDLLH